MICPRCKREVNPWPLKRGGRCSPKEWAKCIRNDHPSKWKGYDPVAQAYEMATRRGAPMLAALRKAHTVISDEWGVDHPLAREIYDLVVNA